MFAHQSYRATLSLLLLLAVTPCTAQQAAPTIDAVLARVRENISEFKKSVPGFVSDESALSQRFVNNKLKEEMKIESSFEVKRRGGTGDMLETRTTKLVDGKTPKNQKIEPPYFYRGGFADALGSVDSKCLAYSLGEAPDTDKTILILSTPKPVSSDRPAECHFSPSFSMKAFVDPQTFQIIRLEYTVQDVDVDMGIRGHIPFVAYVTSRDNVSTFIAEYAPVELGSKTYWLPKTVISDLKDKDDRKNPVHLRYEAHYANYHKFAVSSTILPGEVVQTQN
jgi:hypothetical protein